MEVQHAMAINQNNTFSFKARLNRILTWASPHKIPKLYRRHFDGESWTQNGRKFWASLRSTNSISSFFPTRKRHGAAAAGDDVGVLRDYSAAVGGGGERAAPRVVVRIAAAADADRRRGGALRVHGMSLQ